MVFFSSLDGSSFLPLMEEKKQKKIKASGTPAILAGYLLICYQLNNSTNKQLNKQLN